MRQLQACLEPLRLMCRLQVRFDPAWGLCSHRPALSAVPLQASFNPSIAAREAAYLAGTADPT